MYPKMTLEERCNVAAACLQKAEYRTRLELLHSEMLAEIARLRAALPARPDDRDADCQACVALGLAPQ